MGVPDFRAYNDAVRDKAELDALTDPDAVVFACTDCTWHSIPGLYPEHGACPRCGECVTPCECENWRSGGEPRTLAEVVPDLYQSQTACCPRETIPDSCSCLAACDCTCLDCDCAWGDHDHLWQ